MNKCLNELNHFNALEIIISSCFLYLQNASSASTGGRSGHKYLINVSANKHSLKIT